MLVGIKADGSKKVRPCDDMTRSHVNPATAAAEKLEYESLDKFLALMRMANKRMRCPLALWKADIDSAYRRIPLKPEHLKYAWVVFKDNGETIVAQHASCPFGAVSSVHNWDRVG